MKNLWIFVFLLTASISQAGQVLKQVEVHEEKDAMVPVAFIEDFKSISVSHKKAQIVLTARLMMVHIGTAAGFKRVMLNLIDSGPSQGDYGNTYIYNLGNIVDSISELNLQKSSKSQEYILSYKASSKEMTDQGEFKDVDASKRLKIKLDKKGLLTSVEEI